MAVSSEKKFFLDKLIRENNIDICEVLKTNIDYELAGSHNYHLFTHENINVSNEPMTKEDVLNEVSGFLRLKRKEIERNDD